MERHGAAISVQPNLLVRIGQKRKDDIGEFIGAGGQHRGERVSAKLPICSRIESPEPIMHLTANLLPQRRPTLKSKSRRKNGVYVQRKSDQSSMGHYLDVGGSQIGGNHVQRLTPGRVVDIAAYK